MLLRNGDRLSGTIVSLSKNALVLRSPHAGELSLDWGAVATLSTDAPLAVMRRGREPERAQLLAGQAGRVRLVGPAGERTIALEEIAYLNPKAHESGAGTDYSGRAALSASYARGNTTTDRLYADGELTARARPYRYGISGKAERRAEAGVRSMAWRGGANYDRFLDARRFLYARASLEHDLPKDIELRRALGAGYGVQLADSQRSSVSLRAGLDHVAVRRQVAEDERYPAFGWALTAEHGLWRKLRLFHEHEGYWNLEDTARLFVRSKSGLRMPLVARLSASVQLNLDWERRPAGGRRATDTTLLVGLDYAW